MTAPDPESPEAFRATIRHALLKGFAIPVAVLVFFAAAPAWLDHNLHTSVAEAIAKSDLPAKEREQRLAAFARIDFAEVCRATPPGLEPLRADLWKYSPLSRLKLKTLQLDLGLIPGKQQETFETLARYLSRQTK